MSDFKHLSVADLKKFVREYKHIHCKPFSKLNREGLIKLANEIEAHEGKREVIPKMSSEEVEEYLMTKRSMRKPRAKKEKAPAPVKEKVVKEKVTKLSTEGGKNAWVRFLNNHKSKFDASKEKYTDFVKRMASDYKSGRTASSMNAVNKEHKKAVRTKKTKAPANDAEKVVEKQQVANNVLVSAMKPRKGKNL